MSYKAFVACAGALAAAATLSGIAFAADLTPPPPPVPIFTWTGLYVGGLIGYAWGNDPIIWSGISNDDELAAGTFSNTPKGVIGGAHVGYNLQYNQWLVLGIEGSVDGTSLRHNAQVPVNDSFGDTPGIVTATSKASVQGSIRSRIGVAFDRVLIYGTGGVALTNFNTTLVDTTGFFTGGQGTNTSFSNTRAGWTAGGGVEYAVTDNWWVRAEYRYSNFGHTTDFPFPGELPFDDSFVFLRHHLTENQVQAGFSYRFDWTAPQPPVPWSPNIDRSIQIEDSTCLTNFLWLAPAPSPQRPLSPASVRLPRHSPMSCAFCQPITARFSLLVGFHVEPAFEDRFSAVDVILSTFDGSCPAPNTSISIGQPIDADGTMTAKNPDTVNLKVDALYLKKAVRPAGPFGSIAPTGIEAKLTITDGSPLAEEFGNPGTYNSWFRPTHPGNATTGGAYGFHVYGKVHAGSNSFSCPGDKKPRPLAAKNRYDQCLCSVAGSLAAPDNFGCVAAIQPFPGHAGDGYEPDSAFHPHAP